MLTGFEEIQSDLTDDEKAFARWLVPNLAKHIGKEMSITNKTIRERLEKMGKGTYSDAFIRRIIHFIRVENLVMGLIATSRGYYVVSNASELKDYIESLEQRENQIRQIRIKAQQYYRHLSIQKPTLLPVETVYNG